MESIKRIKTSQKVTIVGAIVNLLLSLIKIFIGFIGNSSALIADGIHSFSDLISDGIVWYVVKITYKKPDAEHPYGHEKFETIAILGLSIILTIIGTGIIFGAIRRIYNPVLLTNQAMLLSVAILSILFKEILYWYTLNIGKKIQSNLLKINAWHHRSDALSSVVVLIGIIGTINGYLYLDAIAAIIVGFMIIYIAWKIGIKAIKELVDTSISAKEVDRLYKALEQIDGVINIHSLRTRKRGNKISCDVHVQVEPFLSVSEGHIISVSVENIAKKCFQNPIDVTVHIDPEDDETNTLYENLPEHAQALTILKTALKNNNCYNQIERIQLHYLSGSIHVDFYLAIKEHKNQKILQKIKTTVQKLKSFSDTRIYFA